MRETGASGEGGCWTGTAAARCGDQRTSLAFFSYSARFALYLRHHEEGMGAGSEAGSRSAAASDVSAQAEEDAQVRDLGHERVVRVGIREQRANREQHLGDRQRGRPARGEGVGLAIRLGVENSLRQGGAPLVLQNVETNAAVRVDVRVVDLRVKLDLRRVEGVLERKESRREGSARARQERSRRPRSARARRATRATPRAWHARPSGT